LRRLAKTGSLASWPRNDRSVADDVRLEHLARLAALCPGSTAARDRRGGAVGRRTRDSDRVTARPVQKPFANRSVDCPKNQWF
jgi:hypothetical protein